jgi:hypothetical protein
MEISRILTEFEAVIQDSSYDETWQLLKINECLILLATMCRIPGLQRTEAITAGAASSSAPMSKKYLHDLYQVTTPTYPQGLLLAPNLKALKETFDPEQTGAVAMVALEYKTLHYRPIPEEEEVLTCSFYGLPAELAESDDLPAYIPELFQKEIFLNYLLKEAFMKIEDGIDGVMFNTQKYGNAYAGALATIQELYPHAPKARPEIKRAGSFF